MWVDGRGCVWCLVLRCVRVQVHIPHIAHRAHHGSGPLFMAHGTWHRAHGERAGIRAAKVHSTLEQTTQAKARGVPQASSDPQSLSTESELSESESLSSPDEEERLRFFDFFFFLCFFFLCLCFSFLL